MVEPAAMSFCSRLTSLPVLKGCARWLSGIEVGPPILRLCHHGPNVHAAARRDNGVLDIGTHDLRRTLATGRGR